MVNLISYLINDPVINSLTGHLIMLQM